MNSSVPGAKFGLAFCEASGPCLIRTEGNDDSLVADAVRCAEAVAAGHTFFLIMKNAFPINVLPQIKLCQEVCRIFCATANPVQVLVGSTEQGNGILGVIDGSPPKGVEGESDKADRRSMLRKFGYKF
jgi:adenosine/AMP kinase